MLRNRGYTEKNTKMKYFQNIISHYDAYSEKKPSVIERKNCVLKNLMLYEFTKESTVLYPCITYTKGNTIVKRKYQMNINYKIISRMKLAKSEFTGKPYTSVLSIARINTLNPRRQFNIVCLFKFILLQYKNSLLGNIRIRHVNSQ